MSEKIVLLNRAAVGAWLVLAGISQVEVGRELGVSASSTLSERLKGTRTSPRHFAVGLARMIRSKGLRCRLEDLLRQPVGLEFSDHGR